MGVTQITFAWHQSIVACRSHPDFRVSLILFHVRPQRQETVTPMPLFICLPLTVVLLPPTPTTQGRPSRSSRLSNAEQGKSGPGFNAWAMLEEMVSDGSGRGRVGSQAEGVISKGVSGAAFSAGRTRFAHGCTRFSLNLNTILAVISYRAPTSRLSGFSSLPSVQGRSRRLPSCPSVHAWDADLPAGLGVNAREHRLRWLPAIRIACSQCRTGPRVRVAMGGA